ncbi:MAG: hypothetical protein U5K79_08320 [Cyclobacteriaceae bacterium]|nr:hypothetical protein [Cyclobacteriaceae bacterium]
MIVVGVNKGTKSATDEVPEIVAACLKETSAKDGLENYLVDQINNPAKFTPEEEEEWKKIVNLTDEQYKNLKEKEGKRGYTTKNGSKTFSRVGLQNKPSYFNRIQNRQCH